MRGSVPIRETTGMVQQMRARGMAQRQCRERLILLVRIREGKRLKAERRVRGIGRVHMLQMYVYLLYLFLGSI